VAKRPRGETSSEGAKRAGAKCPGGETSSEGAKRPGAKRPVTEQFTCTV